jgi:hypothetical protein
LLCKATKLSDYAAVMYCFDIQADVVVIDVKVTRLRMMYVFHPQSVKPGCQVDQLDGRGIVNFNVENR